MYVFKNWEFRRVTPLKCQNLSSSTPKTAHVSSRQLQVHCQPLCGDVSTLGFVCGGQICDTTCSPSVSLRAFHVQKKESKTA
jgi:hypothetical protein